ncbi:MAG: hypothetical protein AAGB29_12215 [Planctomycetota bacterium]
MAGDFAPDASAGTTDLSVRLVDGVRCLDCGYNLRSVLSDGVCPECGSPVERSLRRHWDGFAMDAESRLIEPLACFSCGDSLRGRSIGEACPSCGAAVMESMRRVLLDSAPADWLRGARRGIIAMYVAMGLWAVAGMLAGIGGMLAAISSGSGVNFWVWMTLSAVQGLVAGAVWLWGLFVFTAAEPGGRPRGDVPSVRTARVAEVIRFALMLVSSGVTLTLFWSGTMYIGQMVGPGVMASQVVAMAVLALGSVSMAGVVWYGGRLLGRAPGGRLRRQANGVGWTILVCGVLMGAGQVAQISLMQVATVSAAQNSMAATAKATGQQPAGVMLPPAQTFRQSVSGGEITTTMTSYPDGSMLVETVKTDASGSVVSTTSQVQAGFQPMTGGGLGGVFWAMLLSQCGGVLAMIGLGVGYVWALVLSILLMLRIGRAIASGASADAMPGPA